MSNSRYKGIKSVYLAGKIGKNDWRNSIVPGLKEIDGGASWPVIENGVGGVFDYAGPYFVSGEHGWFHDTEHAIGGAPDYADASEKSRRSIFDKCEKAITNADFVICYLDSMDAYGTLVEIGMARAQGKAIVIYASPEIYSELTAFTQQEHGYNVSGYGELWFVAQCSDRIIPTKDPAADIIKHVQVFKRIDYYEYIKSPEWKAKSRDAKERAGWKCQLCSKPGSNGDLHTHHNNYERLGRELPSDLIVLCANCHAKFHDKSA